MRGYLDMGLLPVFYCLLLSLNFGWGGSVVYPAAGMSRLLGETSGNEVQPGGQWPGTWEPAGVPDGRHRGQRHGRDCRSARRLDASEPLCTH